MFPDNNLQRLQRRVATQADLRRARDIDGDGLACIILPAHFDCWEIPQQREGFVRTEKQFARLEYRPLPVVAAIFIAGLDVIPETLTVKPQTSQSRI